MSIPLASIEMFSNRADEDPIGTIAMPVRDHMNSHTATALMHTDWTFLKGRGIDRYLLAESSILTMQRNAAIQQMRGEFLLFIDDDMVWSATAIGDLIASYEELRQRFTEPVMVGGLCFRRAHPYQPTLYVREQPTGGSYNFLECWESEIVEVDATGCAFLLIPVEALEAIAGTRMPPYEVRAGSQICRSSSRGRARLARTSASVRMPRPQACASSWIRVSRSAMCPRSSSVGINTCRQWPNALTWMSSIAG